MYSSAIKIVNTLRTNGFKAYFAGGYVRDLLLGLPPGDIDIATDAKPDQIEKLFAKTIPVGKQFGVMLVVLDNKAHEVATFRSEGEYLDKRRPSSVRFVGEKEDALRRDFTINGMFYDPVSTKVIDYVGGQKDLKNRIIRFIGNAKDRIEEDNLRLLRAVRFKIILGFKYQADTYESLVLGAKLIKNVSGERIKYELNRIFGSKMRSLALPELSQIGLLKYILPEIENLKGVPQPKIYHQEGDVYDHTCLAVNALSGDTATHLVWAVLLHDVAKAETIIETDRIRYPDHAAVSAKMATTILNRLKFPSFEIGVITWLIANHMKIAVIDNMRPSKRLAFLTDPKFPDLIRLARADALGTHPIDTKFVNKLIKAVSEAKKWKEERANLKELKLITGDDLIKFGLEPGIEFKEILETIEDMRLDGKITNKKEAIEYLKKKFKNSHSSE